MNKYPNLGELIKYYPCGEPTVCDHAGIGPELLRAVLNGDEALTLIEVIRLSRLYKCPAGVISCPKAIMLDMDRYRHKKIVAEVDALYMRLKWMADTGNTEAGKYLERVEWEWQRFVRAVSTNKLSYGHYLGIKEHVEQYVSFAIPKPKRRGVSQYVGKN